MASRRSCLLFALAVLALLVAAAGGGFYWFRYGPGFEAEIDRLVRLVELRPGMSVADVGAGNGRVAVRVAGRLGPAGRLYATEIEASKLEAIRRAAADAGLDNITTLEAGRGSTNLPDHCCDVIYLRRVYHHLPDPVAIDRSLYSALRPGGRLVIIDFLTPSWLFFFHHGIAPDTVAGQLTEAGLILERRIDGWSPIGYCFVFRKP